MSRVPLGRYSVVRLILAVAPPIILLGCEQPSPTTPDQVAPFPPSASHLDLSGRCAVPEFSVGQTYGAVNPGSLAAADFDRDGRLDLAVAEGLPFQGDNASTVRVLFGDGDGGFSQPTTFEAASPEFVLAEDLNRDGKVDLAVANPGPDLVSVLHGQPGANFGAPASFPAGLSPGAIAPGDFDRDGVLDLAVANKHSDPATVSILLGIPGGGYASPVDFPTGPVGVTVASIVAGDFDRDGALDLAVATGDEGDVAVLSGDGQGGFSSPVRVFANFPEFVVAHDVDLDGRLDLVVANPGPDRVSVLRGDGAGAFGTPVDYPVGLQPRSIAVADLNRDGRPDIAAANASSDEVSILLGDGHGSFTGPMNISVPSGPWSILAGDFKRDGALDLAVAAVNTQEVFVLINSCRPQAGTP